MIEKRAQFFQAYVVFLSVALGFTLYRINEIEEKAYDDRVEELKLILMLTTKVRALEVENIREQLDRLDQLDREVELESCKPVPESL